MAAKSKKAPLPRRSGRRMTRNNAQSPPTRPSPTPSTSTSTSMTTPPTTLRGPLFRKLSSSPRSPRTPRSATSPRRPATSPRRSATVSSDPPTPPEIVALREALTAGKTPGRKGRRPARTPLPASVLKKSRPGLGLSPASSPSSSTPSSPVHKTRKRLVHFRHQQPVARSKGISTTRKPTWGGVSKLIASYWTRWVGSGARWIRWWRRDSIPR